MRLTIASGKGGTGKTTVATSLAWVLGRKGKPVQYVDCDVEEPNGHLFLKSVIEGVHTVGVPTPRIDPDRCTGCGECVRVGRFIPCNRPRPIAFGVWVTGPVPRVHPEETPVEFFCLDSRGEEPDPLVDDQALVLETEQGLVVCLGCAHAGLINTLDHIRSLSPGVPIAGVLGGFHLRAFSLDRMEWTLNRLRLLGSFWLAPMHCTGTIHTARLWTAFPRRCREGGGGHGVRV